MRMSWFLSQAHSSTGYMWSSFLGNKMKFEEESSFRGVSDLIMNTAMREDNAILW